MTVPTTTNKVIATGNGVATVFPFAFGTLPSGDLVVTLIDLDGIEYAQVENTDYTVQGEGDEDGGSVTFIIAPPTDQWTVLIQRILPETQPTDLKNQGSFFPRTIERMLDRVTMLIQQLSERIGSALTLPAWVTGVSTELPAPEANKLIGWNETPDGLRNFSISELATTLAFSNFKFERFTATAGQAMFELESDPGALANLDVSVDGVAQVAMDDYTLTGRFLNFTTPLTAGQRVFVRYGTALPPAVGLTYVTYPAIATGGQTVFDLPQSYIGGAGAMSVYADGLRLRAGADYIETSPTRVTLTTPALDGQEFTFVFSESVSTTVAPASAVQFLQAGTGAVPRSMQDKGREWVSVKDFGAVGDGVVDDSAAIQSAINALSTAGGGALYFPPGRYPALNLQPKSNVCLAGAGCDASILMVPTGNAAANTIILNLTDPLSGVSMESLGFEGRWDQFQSELASNGLVTVKFATNLRIRGCAFRYSRGFSMNINECTRVSVKGCLFEYGARDFAAVWGTPDVEIDGNVLRGNDDDAISVNWETAGADPVRAQIIIRGNLCEDTGSIRTQAPKNVIITGNTMRRMKGTGIQLGVNNVSTNDISSAHGIVITDNVITDVIDRQWFVSGDLVGSVNNRIGILIRSIPTRAGALAVAPGEVNPAAGTVVAPYDWYYKRGSIAAATGSIRAPDGAIVRGNIVKRTLPAVTNYADWGYGQAYTKNGFVNYQVTDAVLRGIGCRIELPWTNLAIDGNSFEAGRYGIDFTLATGVTIANRLAKGIVVSGNVIKDADNFGINWSPGTLSHQDITIDGNAIDCDPYFSSSNRGTLGTWLADAAPVGMRLQNLGGVTVNRNRFRNCCRVIEQTGASGFQNLSANELFGDAAAPGFSTSNKGIGNVPGIAAGEQYWFQYEDSDPTSATYSVSLGANVRNSAAMPSSGKWFAGQVVGARSTTVSGAASSQYMVRGWVRATTGSAHVLNTDWREMRTLTGT